MSLRSLTRMRRNPAPSPASAALLSSPSTSSAPGRTARGSQPGEKRAPGARLRCPTCLVPFRATFTRCPRDGSSLVWQIDDPLIGTTFADRYVLEALVGEGAMGLVYRAHHARLSHRLFAVKIMFGDVAAEAAMRMRFAQEADSASRFCHPNVVSVLDFGRTDRGILYLAMDYVDGETLASLIRRQGPLDETRVVSLTRQLARGLGHAHNAGLVHRDFKPANVAIAVGDDGGELARVLDFGLAISEHEGDRVGRLTEHGLVVGTPIYIAPEQARDQAVDHRADLFALGVVMYEMLTGKTPFEGSGAEIARANVQQKPPALSQRNPQVRVTPELEAIVFKLLEKRPSDRYQSAEEVISALDRFERKTRPAASAEQPVAEPATATLWLPGGSTPVAQPAVAWTGGMDGAPTLGMGAHGPVNRIRRRGVTAVAWVASAVAAAVVASTLAGSYGLGGSAKAATVSDEERSSSAAEPADADRALASDSAVLGLFGVKMNATPSRCSNVPHAERIAAESPKASHARSAVKRSEAQKRRARAKLSTRPRHRTLAVRDAQP